MGLESRSGARSGGEGMKRGAALFACLLASCATPQAAPGPLLAITIDDVPVHAPYPPGTTANAVNAQMIAALTAEHVPAMAFFNGIGIERQPETMTGLEQWRAAGLVVGNHTWSHRHLSEMSPAEFEAEVTRNEPILGRIGGGSDWRWFRYPFLDEGENAAKRVAGRQALARHGYRVAAVTMSFSDWQWTAPYARCLGVRDDAAVAELERLYLASAKENAAVARDTSRKLYGRDIPYVLLMHVSAMSAHMMPQLLRLYRDAGFRFVSLADAERDPSYREYTDLSLAPPPSPWDLAAKKGVQIPVATDYSAKLAAMCPGGGAAVSSP
jgi:peptidoglycan/xylan/chitin deacetylase (PgdA/CDA1 family)